MDWLAHENASNSPNDNKIQKTHTFLDRLGAIVVLTMMTDRNANNPVCDQIKVCTAV
jgi:hypothetical protein